MNLFCRIIHIPIKKYLRKFPLKLLLLIALFILSVFLFGFIVHEVLWEKEETFDAMVSNFMAAHIVTDRLTKTVKVITFFGSMDFLLIAYTVLALLYLIIKKNKTLVLDISTIGISGFLITFFLKELFRRVRPSDPLIDPLRNYSFPSGHASSGFIFYGLLIYLIWKENITIRYKYIIAVLLLLFSLLVGFSGIYLRIHYASDVIAGFCIGFTWFAFSIWILERSKKKAHYNTCLPKKKTTVMLFLKPLKF
jgi:membrane-associated phospholipid phosphatase